MKIPAESLLILLRIYKVAVSPVLTAMLGPMGLGCRYTPTCSDYARSAIREHGAIRGMGMTLGRLARCHPWGGWGDDPVPPAGNRVDSKTCCHHGS